MHQPVYRIQPEIGEDVVEDEPNDDGQIYSGLISARLRYMETGRSAKP
jgi:hypothetical protein